MNTDPIADMLTRIRNASMAKHTRVVMPSSKMKASIGKILLEEGFIQACDVIEEEPQSKLALTLKYTEIGNPVITGLTRISKPGRRIYTGYQQIPWVRSGLGINILSTPRGMMTGRNARRAKVGGEIVCNVW